MNNNELQLLCITLDDDQYGLDITKVQEIRALGKHRSLPNMPNHCVGVIDFRNTMVPVIDLRELFGYQHSGISTQTVIVVLLVEYNNQEMLLGIVVDSVSDVIAVDKDTLKASPTIGAKVDTSFIKGMFKHGNSIVVVLTLEPILEVETMSSLKEIVGTKSSSV